MANGTTSSSVPWMISLLRTLAGRLAVEDPGLRHRRAERRRTWRPRAPGTALRWLRSRQGIDPGTGRCSSAIAERATEMPAGSGARADPHFASLRPDVARLRIPFLPRAWCRTATTGEAVNRTAGLDHPRDGRRRGSVRHGERLANMFPHAPARPIQARNTMICLLCMPCRCATP